MRAQIDEIIETLSGLGPFADIVRREVAATRLQFGDRVAAQRLWSMLLAAAHDNAYREVIADRATQTDRLYDRTAAVETILNEALAPHARLASPDFERVSRVLICLGYLPPTNRHGSHLHQVCCFAAALAMRPEIEAVLILETGEIMPEGNGLSRLYGPTDDSAAASWTEALAAVLSGVDREKVAFHRAARVGPVHPIGGAIAPALDFRPNAILYFLGAVQSHLMPGLMQITCPQIGIQFHVANVAPGPCDLVLGQGDATNFAEKSRSDRWAAQQAPLVPLASNEAAAFDLPLVDCRLVTVLGHGRIERVLRTDAVLRRQVVDFLDRHPGVEWVFVGVADAERLAASDRALQRLRDTSRIRLLAPTQALRTLYRACDLYVHLPNLGGGGMGIATAIVEGVPALVEASSDAANFIVEGRYATASDLFARLASIVGDPAKRHALAAQQVGRIAREHSLAAVGKSLLANIKLAACRFREKTGG